MWILTFEVNDYNQHGSYFVKAWKNKPSKINLATTLLANDLNIPVDDVYNNIGRTERYQEIWCNFFEQQN